MAIIKLEDLFSNETFRTMYSDYVMEQLKKTHALLAMLPPSPPPTRWQRFWHPIRNVICRARTWLGEKIAGRSFGDDY